MRKRFPLIVLALAIVASIVAVVQMPDQVPVHWNMKGEVDGHGSRWLVGGMMPPFMLAIWMLLRAIPRFDPKRENYVKFQGSYDVVVNATMVLMLVVHFMMLAGALGLPIARGIQLVVVASGVLLVVMGNVMPRARQNWMFGIRTPWTLSSERVWDRSHRNGGYVMMAAGLLVIAGAFLREPYNLIALAAVTMTAALWSVIYSYLVWKQEGPSSAPPAGT